MSGADEERPRRSAFLRALYATHRFQCPLLAAMAARQATRRPLSSTPDPGCESYRALHHELSCGAGAGPGGEAEVPVHRLLESARRGNHVPYASVSSRCIPTERTSVIATYKNRVYGGRFVRNGQWFVTSCMDRLIRIYESNTWNLIHRIPCEDVRWTVTDFDVSHDGRWLVYTTINQYVHLVDLHCALLQRTFCAIHPTRNDPEHFGIMSCTFSNDAKEIIVGCTGTYMESTGTFRVIHIERGTAIICVDAHAEDVNSVHHLLEDDPNRILTGGDDGFAKLWDLRCIARARPGGSGECHEQTPCQGTFVGHVEGLTHVNSRDDGRYFISQGKDQCIKLWDVRKPFSSDSGASGSGSEPPQPPKDRHWDYRFESYPGRLPASDSYPDHAVMTYAGAHQTLQTLIRSYFSPKHSTAQRYIYTGSGSCEGTFAVYDVLTGAPVVKKKAHRAAVRDVSWHPTVPMLTTVGWDNNVLLWSTNSDNAFVQIR